MKWLDVLTLCPCPPILLSSCPCRALAAAPLPLPAVATLLLLRLETAKALWAGQWQQRSSCKWEAPERRQAERYRLMLPCTAIHLNCSTVTTTTLLPVGCVEDNATCAASVCQLGHMACGNLTDFRCAALNCGGTCMEQCVVDPVDLGPLGCPGRCGKFAKQWPLVGKSAGLQKRPGAPRTCC